MLNQPSSSRVRYPRAIVHVNGVAVPGWEHIDVTENSFYEADTFLVEWPLSGLPSAYDWAWWAQQRKVLVAVYIGFPEDPEHPDIGGMDLMITGYVDDYEVDVIGQTLTVQGRDMTALMIDGKTTNKWPDYTGSGMAEALAKKYGLTPKVTATTQKIGAFYQTTSFVQTLRSDWEVLTYAAQHSKDSAGRPFVCYVQGTVLYFGPAPAEDSDPYVLQVGGDYNVVDMKFGHNLGLARDISVTVQSWSGFTGSKISKTAKGPTGSGIVQNYLYVIPGLDPQKAYEVAAAKLAELSAHEMRLTGDLPGDNILHIDTVIEVRGTGTKHDQRYYPALIVRTFSPDPGVGYTMNVQAKNHQTNPMVTE